VDVSKIRIVTPAVTNTRINAKIRPMFKEMKSYDKALYSAAETAIAQSLKVRKDERVCIVTNPLEDVYQISAALYDACLDLGAQPVLLVQPVKSQLDFAAKEVIGAIGSGPDVFISISAEKIGKDEEAQKNPYTHESKSFDHVFDYLIDGKKTLRAFWSPSVTKEIFIQSVPIDYEVLKRRSLAIKKVMDEAVELRVTSPRGTDCSIGIRGRRGQMDNGDYSSPGDGGNLPAGETFISPANGTTSGTIVFDGSISLYQGEIIIKEPIVVKVENGFAVSMEGGREADQLRATLEKSSATAREFEKQGKLKEGLGEVYAKNAWNIGELGIGLNPKATVIGNMLQDEKVFKTCHIAIGSNYDDDANALTHLDGLIHNPTITAVFEDGSEAVIMKNGELETD